MSLSFAMPFCQRLYTIVSENFGQSPLSVLLGEKSRHGFECLYSKIALFLMFISNAGTQKKLLEQDQASTMNDKDWSTIHKLFPDDAADQNQTHVTSALYAIQKHHFAYNFPEF